MHQGTIDVRTVRALFTADEWAQLSAVRPGRLVMAAGGTWLSILGSLWLWASYPHPLIFLLSFCVIATRQHALNNLVHEAAHYSITRRKALNDWISDIFFAAPHLISTDAYRQKHLLHHRDLGDPVTDGEFKPRYVIRRSRFLKHTFLALFGFGAYVAIRSYRPAPGSPAAAPPRRHYVLVPVTNGLLASYCWWLGTPAAYLSLWLLPLFTLTIYISTLRVIAEHQPTDYALSESENLTGRMPAFTRSITAGAIERFVFGPVNFCYHYEHHLAPGIPFPHLPRLHSLLRERGFYSADDDRVCASYIGTLANLVLPREQPPGRGPRLERQAR